MKDCNTVLLVEDEREIREGLAEVLEEEGYAVVQARNGREGLDQLRAMMVPHKRPCLIVLDLMMPVMDGFQFRAEQLRDAELAAIPVLVVSADANVRSKAAAMQVSGSLAKPIQLQQFVDVVVRHCGKAA